MTSTLSRMNSAAISAKRSSRPSAQRYSMATVRFSIQPSSRSRCTKASVDALSNVALFAPRNPMVGSLPGCCARAASGHATAAPPSNVMNSRRLMLDIELPPALAPASSGFVLAAAAEPPLADGITRQLALPEELHIGHDRLIRMVGSPMRYIRVVVGNADHQVGRSPGPIDGRARRSRGAIEQILKVRHGHLPRPRRQVRFPPQLPAGSLAPSIY